MGERKGVFVTVGTTSFDKLVEAVDSAPVKEALFRRGFSHLQIQIGRGTYLPSKVSGQEGCLEVDYFTFSPSIADHLKAASLVISHAGSGSIFETLRLNKPLVVVVNEDLMDNHQAELAEELANRKHLFFARGPHLLAKTIESMDLESLVPYTPGDPNDIAAQIDASLGLNSPAEGSVKKGGEGESEGANISKSKAKKDAKKAEKAEKAAQRQQQAKGAASAAAGGSESGEADPLSSNYGDVPVEDIQSKFISGRVGELCAEMKDKSVLIRGAAQVIRPVSKKMAFLVIRQSMSTVQCVLVVSKDLVSPQMVRFATSLSKESIVDVEGVISVPNEPIKGTTQQVEIQVRKLYCINRAIPNLPINIEDASRSETDFKKAEEKGEQLVRVGQDTRLNYRVLDLRTPANQATFRIQCQVENVFRLFLLSENFVGIHSPKLTPGSSEGGAAVFKLDYKGQPACLAQSPQLYKQMALCGGFDRVFEVGSVFRAEDSYTHRHLCEFVGLDVEMEIKEHYFEVCDIVDRLFVAMFDHLNKNCSKELETINHQYPFQPLKYLRKTLRLTYAEGIQMLKEAGTELEPMADLNTESEKKLGKLVSEKYNTDFYILTRYPLGVRPFYTMPCYDNPAYSNSFDVFIRGEEIISGAQRVHLPELLTKRAEECGIDIKTISTYIDSFRYGAPPHGGFGVGLERVVMLFCGLNNIRKTSLFPRDPQRLVP
ncbi:aspartate--tRNA ligase [Carex littledalei]|uniref:aspartate--tRNA ligase n=1 Tax=Carex littledalei TaxID=544730 RepID=A0A833QNV7_9POAL|nr:aspartate--tRNA ligase [Carex littledalei]